MAAKLLPEFMDVEGKVILVTGGAVGIGAGLVKELLSQNARHVAFLDVLDREGVALEGELLNKFGALRAKFIKCDISDERQLSAAYQLVMDKYRRLDAVVNNAAVFSEENYKKMVDVNFTATVTSTYKALEVMSVDKGGSGGVVLNISSLMALKPQENFHLPVYAATKTAVLHFSNHIATQESYSKTQVRIVTVCLGLTDTALLHRHKFETQESKSLASQLPEKQRVTSAVSGIMFVIRRAESGSTWIIADDEPPIDVTCTVREGFRCVATAI
ncbi:15-hydroxyprostaglandin dehydrogenase [NAD(+)]-like [Maniola jurtina]|uniref:15-hydroxyprostaglandin dehydrogenase [NAD(+)]-like n=1 Tax=Maniola jurtina TaxID=191418 RepID=UPI001E68880A|nr:15-hydroxyprostaglandin dehydrogenase [NAD(+)]-like [Maniola jurtina]XP_045785454.1 15-hydroxyprostaglandin dehydrogenase [NAD(+)]-like [Maniola jurtina]